MVATVTTCVLRTVITPSVLVGATGAATQFAPSNRCQVVRVPQLPEAVLR